MLRTGVRARSLSMALPASAALLWTLGATLTATAQGMCVEEGECSFRKPNVLILMDYSSSMVGFEQGPNYYPEGQFSVTRWDAQLEAVRWIVGYDDGVFANNMRLGLARFGHDPDLETAGTVLASDTSFPPITDGFALDVPFEDAEGNYFECLGSAVAGELAVLATTPPPWIGNPPGPDNTMATWTRGALRSAHALFNETRARHADEAGEDGRSYHVVLMTDGEWTCADRFGQNCEEDPAPEAAVLRDDGISVHVVGFGDAADLASLDEVARRGGTGEAVDARSPKELIDAVTAILDDIRNSVIIPECIAGLPRVMIVMDGSTSMIEGNAPGETNWDKARYALAGNPDATDPQDPGYVESIFRRQVEVAGEMVTIEDVTHVALMAFADADSQTLMVPYAPCARDNIAWAMDPWTSCVAPSCDDPYAGPPLTWTFQNSQTSRMPPFRQETQSFMPDCNRGDGICRGDMPNTYTGEGLAFAIEAVERYRADPEPFGLHEDTPFINILITDGETTEGSEGAEANLTRLVELGIDTYVIGFGTPSDLNETQLEQYAGWGNTESAVIVNPEQGDSADGLAEAIAGIVAGLGLDPCCAINDCAMDPEPPDPPPVCGDGALEGEEACDDGNRARNDGCDPSCQIERPLVDRFNDDDAGSEEGGPSAESSRDRDTDMEVAANDPDGGKRFSDGDGGRSDPLDAGASRGPDGAIAQGPGTAEDGCSCSAVGARSRAPMSRALACLSALGALCLRVRRRL